MITLDPVFNILIPFLQNLPRRPVIIEIGQHWGESSKWLKAFCSLPPFYMGFEADYRNVATLREGGENPEPYAIADKAGDIALYLSGGITPSTLGREHTDSSSIQKPTQHLETHPWCTFTEEAVVEAFPLDHFTGRFEHIDLIWCDIQGAQRRFIAGAQASLAKTTLLYIEVHPEPQYEDEPTFEELCALLPDWNVLERFPADVLLRRKGS
jgi:FkbM family methyltransferase